MPRGYVYGESAGGVRLITYGAVGEVARAGFATSPPRGLPRARLIPPCYPRSFDPPLLGGVSGEVPFRCARHARIIAR